MSLFLITGMNVGPLISDIETFLLVNKLNYKKCENDTSLYCYYVVAEEQAIKDFEGKNKQNLTQYENIRLLLEENEDIHLIYNIISPEKFSSHSAGTVDESCETWLQLANDAMNLYFDFMEQISIGLHQQSTGFCSHLSNILKLDSDNSRTSEISENENGSESLHIVTRNLSALIELMNKPHVQEAYERIIALSDLLGIENEDFEIEHRLKSAIHTLNTKASNLELSIEQIKLIEKMLSTEDLPLEEFLFSFQKLRESCEESQQNILLKNNVIDSLQEKLESLESDRHSLVRDISILQSNTDVFKAKQETYHKTSNELIASKLKIKDIEAKLELEIATTSALEDKIKHLNKEASELASVKNQLGAVLKEREVFKDELEKIKENILQLKTENSEYEEHVKLLNIHTNQLREELEQLNAEQEKVQTKYKSKSDEVNSLKSVINDMEKVETEKTAILTELTEELELCELQISHLQNELDLLYKDNIENAKFRINEVTETELQWKSFSDSVKLLQAL